MFNRIHRWTLSSLLILPAAAAWSAPGTKAAPRRARVTVAQKTTPNAPAATRRQSPSEAPNLAAPAVPVRPERDPSEERIKALEEQLRLLQERIQQLEKHQPVTAPATEAPAPAATPTPEPADAAPPAEAPAEPPAPAEPSAEPAPTLEEPVPAPEEPAPAPQPVPGSATLLPNISGIGNFKFSGGDTKGTEGRGKFRLSEFELGIQDRVAPNMRVDAFLAAAQEEGWEAGLEEAYLTWTTPLGLKNLSARIGRQRTLLGKLNPQHPHTWPYVTQPPVIGAYLGPEGLNSDGILFQYLLPMGGNFLNLELGRWETASEAEDGLGFAGGANGAYSGRLWFGREVGRNRELELGLSHYWGRGDVEELGRPMLSVSGLDFTYRSYPSAYQRLLLQGELFMHSTGGVGERERVGGYLTLAKRVNRYYEAGLRGDYTRFPYPTPGHESGGSLFLTRFLTESSALRLELRHGSRPEDGTYNEAWLQILTGFGPHSHTLQ